MPRGVYEVQDRTHRLPPGSVEAMVARQSGLCLICRDPLGSFVVDHDHAMARLHGHDDAHGCRQCVRGLLCAKCNALLGFARDDVEVLRRAARYLEIARGQG